MRKEEKELLLIPFILLILCFIFSLWKISITPMYVMYGSTSMNFTVYSNVTTAVSPPAAQGGPRAAREVIKKIEIVEYPEDLNATRGEVKLFSVTVKNTGNVRLTNVSVRLENTNFVTKTSPQTTELAENSTQTFLVRLEIPDNANLTEYTLTLKTIGDGIIDSKTIKLKIVSLAVKERISIGLEEVSTLMDRIWLEALEAGAEGYNETEVYEKLNEAKRNLRISQEYLLKDDYEKAEFYLEEAKMNLEEAVTKLAESKKPLVLYGTIEYKMILILILCIILAIVLLNYAALRERIEKTFQPSFLYKRKI